MLSYLHSTGYEWKGSSLISMQTPPVCCCFPCLPAIKNSKINLRRLRLLIIQLIAVQATVETFRVLAVSDCSFDPQASKTFIMDGLMTFSFMLGIWPVVIVLRIDYEGLKPYKCIKKFFAFKVMIAVSKFLARILGFLARRDIIKGHNKLGASQRSLIWCNYVTILVALCLQLVSCKLYSNRDYKLCTSKASHRDETEPENEVYERDEHEPRETNDNTDSELIIN